MHRFLREPLVHFLLIGAALFVAYSFANEEEAVIPNRIIVSSGQIEQLSENFKRTWMRSPNETEMKALIESYIREEVFYREALAMGLDQNDPQVRRRMRMKLEYILEDISSQYVTDKDLTLFLEQHPDIFKSETEIAFQQVYFNPDKRENMTADLDKSLLLLNNGTSPDTLGDSILIPFEHDLATQSQIAHSFGVDFANNVINLAPGEWRGPVYSAYGAHIVKINKRIEGSQPTLAEIRELVEREYLAAKRKEEKDEAYNQLRKGYEVIIEPVKTAQVNQVL